MNFFCNTQLYTHTQITTNHNRSGKRQWQTRKKYEFCESKSDESYDDEKSLLAVGNLEIWFFVFEKTKQKHFFLFFG